jgi:hypothetical protein
MAGNSGSWELQRPFRATIGTKHRRATDLFHQPLHQPETMPLGVGFISETYTVVVQGYRGFIAAFVEELCGQHLANAEVSRLLTRRQNPQEKAGCPSHCL